MSCQFRAPWPRWAVEAGLIQGEKDHENWKALERFFDHFNKNCRGSGCCCYHLIGMKKDNIPGAFEFQVFSHETVIITRLDVVTNMAFTGVIGLVGFSAPAGSSTVVLSTPVTIGAGGYTIINITAPAYLEATIKIPGLCGYQHAYEESGS